MNGLFFNSVGEPLWVVANKLIFVPEQIVSGLIIISMF